MARQSAGVLLFRVREGAVEVLLVHPGGPFWAKKDAGSWGIPKGEFGEDEDPRAAAFRELEEETGWSITGESIELDPVRQAGGKTVRAWAVEADADPATLQSNTFSMEWPPQSGKKREFPEVDRAEWFGLGSAREKILQGQLPLLADLERRLRATRPDQRLFHIDGA
jgi:predicted NUDIX family NTP pyrophosphohydrolase